MLEALTVELGDLQIRGRRDPGYQGVSLLTLDGWDDLTDSKASIEERPQGDGAFGLGDDWRSSRMIKVVGHVLAEDYRQAQRVREEIAGKLRRPTLLMRVTDAFSSSWRLVRVLRAKLPRPSTDTFTFTLDIESPDPYRYEDADPTSTGLPSAGTGITWPRTWPITWGVRGATGRMTLSNPGTADARPVFTFHDGGVSDGFEIEEVGTGKLIRFEQTVLIGSEVVITPATGVVTVDGVSRSTFLTSRDWFKVPAGGTTQVQFRTLGDQYGDPILSAVTPPTYV